MSSYEESVLCFYPKWDDAQAAVAKLRAEGTPEDAISVMASGLDHEKALKKSINAPDESERDALTGAGAGGVAGVLGGMSVVTLAGIGSVLAAGPVVGAAVVAGALLGALMGWGVHKNHAAEFEKKIKQGQVLVAAHGDPLLVARAHRILRETGPLEIHNFTRKDDASIADA